MAIHLINDLIKKGQAIPLSDDEFIILPPDTAGRFQKAEPVPLKDPDVDRATKKMLKDVLHRAFRIHDSIYKIYQQLYHWYWRFWGKPAKHRTAIKIENRAHKIEDMFEKVKDIIEEMKDIYEKGDLEKLKAKLREVEDWERKIRMFYEKEVIPLLKERK